jgi:hypothetical protein
MISKVEHIIESESTRVMLMASSTFPRKTLTAALASSSNIKGDSLNWLKNLI